MTSSRIPDIPARQLALWTLGVTAVCLCFWLLIRFQNVVLFLLTAIILSTAIRPAVTRLEKRGLPRPAALLLVFCLIALLLGLLVWASVPVLAAQGAAISQSLADGYQLLIENLQRLPNILVRRLLFILPDDVSGFMPGSAETAVRDEPAAADGQVGPGSRLLVGLFQFVVIVLLTFYWTLEGERIKQAAFLLIPIPRRGAVRELVEAAEAKVGRYLLGQGLLCLIIGGVAFVAYLLIGLPHALLLAVFAGLLEAVPIIGPFLGAVPAFVVALSLSPAAGLWVLLATAIIQQLEGALLVPRVMGRTIGVRPFVTLLSLLAFGSLFGVLGALMALPLAAVLQLLLDRYLLAREQLEQPNHGRDRLSVLQYETDQLVQDIRSQVRHKESVPSAHTDALEDELETIALELESFLAGRAEGTA
ncbi:MAG: AI-2E family transporter [Anaerolineales bacterium]|nr:AI-2E family transporter [Anaerolineales bacterium]